MLILRSKIFSKYIQKWLCALKLKLKRKHINIIAKQFASKKKATLFLKWRSAFLWKRIRCEEFVNRK